MEEFSNENESILLKIKAFLVIIILIFIGFISFIIFGVANVYAESSHYLQFTDTDGNTICGTTGDNLKCNYTTESSGVLTNKKIGSYLVIIENLDLDANSEYMINISYRFQTALYGPEGVTNYLTTYNYGNLTASITGRYSTAAGTIIPSNNRVWSKTSWAKYKTNGDWYGTYIYSYSNTFTPTTDINRLVFKIEKKSWLASFGTYYASNSYVPWISIDNLEYEIIQLSDPDTDKIIASSNKNADDIMNNANANADKVVDAIEGEDLTDEEKESVDKTDINDLNDAEDKLLDENRLNAINDIDISIDSNTNDFIWDFITAAINTHSRIFGFVITILSIGIIKLALNR